MGKEDFVLQEAQTMLGEKIFGGALALGFFIDNICLIFLFLDGGRTRIRTRVAGLEGQSDIQLHYTSNPAEKYLFDEL